MNRIGRNISIILRAERMIARRHLAVTVNRAALIGFAALIAGIGLVMLNLAGFFWLRTQMSPQAAALIVALVNVVLAGVLVAIAMNLRAGTELEPVEEVRDMAIEDVEAELQVVADEARDVADSLRRMARDPLGTALPAVAGPLMGALIRNIKK